MVLLRCYGTFNRCKESTVIANDKDKPGQTNEDPHIRQIQELGAMRMRLPRTGPIIHFIVGFSAWILEQLELQRSRPTERL